MGHSATLEAPGTATSDLADLTRGAGRWEIVYALFATLIYLGVHFGVNERGGGQDLPATDNMATFNQAVLLLGGITLVFRHRRAVALGFADVRAFSLIVIIAAASSLWSQAPDATLRRTLTLATLLMFATFAHAVLGTRMICRIQVAAAWICAFASFAAAASIPSSGFDVAGYAGAIRGVFTQKNSLGDAMTVGMVALSYLALRRRRISWGDLATFLLAVITCRLAQATTSFLLCNAVAAATLLLLMILDGGLLALFGIATSIAAAALSLLVVCTVPIDLFEMIGKDSTLTGRDQIWAAVREAIAQRDILGYGYSAFWLPDAHASNGVWAAIGWVTPSAHSGYLEIQLELGLLGLAIMALLGALTVVLASRALGAGSCAGAWALVLLAVLAVYNADESSLPRPDIHLLQWILAVGACSRALRLRFMPPTQEGAPTPSPRDRASERCVAPSRSGAPPDMPTFAGGGSSWPPASSRH